MYLSSAPQSRSANSLAPSPSMSRASMHSVASSYSVEELYDKIGELRKQHQMNMEEFQKVRSIHKAKMSQGLEEKLEARRQRRTKHQDITPVSI